MSNWFGRALATFVALLFFCGLCVSLVSIFWAPAITINWNAPRQVIDGFGASATGYTADFSEQEADRYFSQEKGLGLSLLKIRPIADTLDASCYCVSNSQPYRCVVNPISQVLSGDLRVAQLASARNVKIFAAPWSPPAAIKSSGNYCAGGTIKGNAANYSRYAAQLAGSLTLLRANGVSLEAFSLQNEPNVEDERYDTCRWTAQQIHDFIPYLSEAFRAANFGSVRLAVPEQTDWKFDLMNAAMADPDVAGKIGLVMGHAYGSEKPSTLPVVGDRHVWQTEVSGFNHFDGSMADGLRWADSIHAFMNIGANAWMYWNLDCGVRYFNHDNNMCLTDQNSHLAKRAYVLGQYARFVRPGWQRVNVNNHGWLLVTAYKGPANEWAIVVVNTHRFAVRNQEFVIEGTSSHASQVVPWLTSESFSLASQAAVILPEGVSRFSYTIPSESVVTFQGGPETAPYSGGK